MIVPYLSFDGKTEEAFNFYKSVMGGEFTSVQRFGDMPQGAAMPAEDQKKIMHLSLETANGETLMGNDHLEAMGMGSLVPGNNFSLSVHPKSEAEAKRIFDGLAAGGTVLMPIDKVFWGAYFGMLIDKFGIKWLVNYQYS
jgi:PhnB protein